LLTHQIRRRVLATWPRYRAICVVSVGARLLSSAGHNNRQRRHFMRMAIAAATVLVSAMALLVPSTSVSARDVENGISELSARGGAGFRAPGGIRTPPTVGVGVGTTGVGVRSKIPNTTIMKLPPGVAR